MNGYFKNSEAMEKMLLLLYVHGTGALPLRSRIDQ